MLEHVQALKREEQEFSPTDFQVPHQSGLTGGDRHGLNDFFQKLFSFT